MALDLPRILVVGAVALCACAGPPAPTADVVSDVSPGRVVVAPLNLTVRAPAPLERDGEAGEAVWSELLGYLQGHHERIAVLSPISAERLWLGAVTEPDSAAVDGGLPAAQARFARALAEHSDYDLLVIPSLVLRSAQLEGSWASWDGAQRPVPNGGAMLSSLASGMDRFGVRAGLRGRIAAASLHVAILTPDGTQVQEGLGGLDVLHGSRRDRPSEGDWTLEVLDHPLAERKHLRQGIERAFEHPLPRTARR